MFPSRSQRILRFVTAVLLPTAVACGSSSPDDAARSESGGGGMMIGAAGNAGSNAVGSAGGTGTSGGGAAGRASTGGAGGAGGNALVDAGNGGRSGSTATADATTIDVQTDGPWKVAPLPAVGTPGIVYLSDLQPTKVALFDKVGGPAQSGPMHNDVSFTGKPLVINGIYYAKGLGVHTFAQITYSLGGAYKQFVSDTGLDYLENSATMIFEVSLDGNLSYDNGNGTKTKDQVAPVS